MLFFVDLFLFFHDLRQLLQRIESIYYLTYGQGLLLHFSFLSNQENRYMIHHNLDLFYDIYNTIIEHNQRQTHYLTSISNYFDIFFEMNEKVFITLSVSSLIMISMLSLFECITRSSSLSNKIVCYC